MTVKKGSSVLSIQKLSTCHIVDLENGITEIRFFQKYTIEQPEIEEIQLALKPILKERSIFLLVIPGAEGNISQEARDLPFALTEDENSVKAIAIITGLLHHRILGKIYFKYKKEKFKDYALFKTETKAVTWLLEQQEI